MSPSMLMQRFQGVVALQDRLVHTFLQSEGNARITANVSGFQIRQEGIIFSGGAECGGQQLVTLRTVVLCTIQYRHPTMLTPHLGFY